MGISTGFDDIDTFTDGLENGDFILVAARPSMGTSALCFQICTHVALKEKKPVVILAYGQGKEWVTNRILMSSERIDGNSLRLSSPDAISQLEAGVAKLSNTPLFLDAPCMKGLEEMIDFCLSLKEEVPDLAVIMIDDLDRMFEDDEEVPDAAQLSKGLKDIAEMTEACVIATVHANRDPDIRKDKRPLLRDLRRNGGIDSYADIVCGLYCESYYNPESRDPKEAEIVILKNSKGPTGIVSLRFDRSCGSFSNLPLEDWSEGIPVSDYD